MRKFAGVAKTVTAEITADARREATAVAALQKQRSSALITIWKSETRSREQESKSQRLAVEREEKQLAALMIREARAAQAVRAQIERAALADIRRMEAERRQIMAQNARAVEALAKSEADARIREGRRAATALANQLGAQQRTSAGTSTLVAGAIGGGVALAGAAAAGQIRQAASAWLDYASNLENVRISFNTMLGSAERADKHLRDLQQFALKTPFEFLELIRASQRMQALGFEAEQVVPILRDVGNAVAAAGGGADRLDRVTLAISQMQSKGKVATQELNQLAEAGIPAWKILETQFGRSRAELVKLVESGQIGSAAFLEAFQNFSRANFGDLMEKQSRTFTGALSNIKDALLQTASTAFEPLYKRISELTIRISGEITKGKPTLESAIRVLLEGAGQAAAEGGVFLGQQIAQGIISGIKTFSFNPVDILKRFQPITFGALERLIDFAAQDKARQSATPDLVSPFFDKKPAFRTPNFSATRLPEAPAKTDAEKGLTDAQREANRLLKQRTEFVVDLQRELKRLRDETQGIDTATRSYSVAQSISNGLLQGASRETQKLAEATAKQIDQTIKIIGWQKQIIEFLKQQNEQIRRNIEGERTHIEVADEFINSLEKQGAVLQETTKFWIRFNGALLQALATAEKLKQTALENLIPGPGAAGVPEGADRILSDAQIEALGTLPEQARSIGNVFQELGTIISDTFNLGATGANAFAESLSLAFGGVAQAVGEAVHAFVLFGSVQGGFRKFAAEVIASIAQMAVVQAVWEAAQGLAMLALAYFTGNPKYAASAKAHFAAAAAFGIVGGVATLAGRAVAGNAFSSSTADGGGGSSTTAQPLNTIVGRNQLQPIVIQLPTIQVNPSDRFGEAVTAHWADDYKNSGVTRQVIHGDGR